MVLVELDNGRKFCTAVVTHAVTSKRIVPQRVLSRSLDRSLLFVFGSG